MERLRDLVIPEGSEKPYTDLMEMILALPAEEFVHILTGFEHEFDNQDKELMRGTYGRLLTRYLLDLRNNQFSSGSQFPYERAVELADDLHNLPGFISDNFNGFSHLYFWNTLRDWSGYYLRRIFIEELSRMYARFQQSIQ